jgi:hypothetical protein
VPATAVAFFIFMVAVAFAAAATIATTQPSNELAYFADNDVAVSRMMAGLKVKTSGDLDRDFATMMIAHHQDAIDMARAELRFGSDERLRRLAQGIVVEQGQEIAAMRTVIHELAGSLALAAEKNLAALVGDAAEPLERRALSRPKVCGRLMSRP